MGDVVEFRPKRLSGFIPADLGESLPGLPQAFTVKPNPDAPEGAVEAFFADLRGDNACSEINPDSGDCA